MNGYQQKQVDRALKETAAYPLTVWEQDFIQGLKSKYYPEAKPLSGAQNHHLNKVMGKFS